MLTRLPSCKITGAILVALVLFVFALANAPKADAGTDYPPIPGRQLPPCAVEDASSGPVPCVWLAVGPGHQGTVGPVNDGGHSFRVFKRIDPRTGNHAYKWITHRRAYQLLHGIANHDRVAS